MAPITMLLRGCMKKDTPLATIQGAMHGIDALTFRDLPSSDAEINILTVTDVAISGEKTETETEPSFVDTDDLVMILFFCHIIAKTVLAFDAPPARVKTITFVLSARKKLKDATTVSDVALRIKAELMARGCSVKMDLAEHAVIHVGYMRIFVYQEVKQTMSCPDEALTGAQLLDSASNEELRALNAPLLRHVSSLNGLITLQCGPMCVPLASLLIAQSIAIGAVSAGDGVNGGDTEGFVNQCSFRGGVLVAQAALGAEHIVNIMPSITRRLRPTTFLMSLMGEDGQRFLHANTFKTMAIPFLASAPSVKPLTLEMRLAYSNSQTTIGPDLFDGVCTTVVAALNSGKCTLTIGDVMHALGCEPDANSIQYAAVYATVFVTNVYNATNETAIPLRLPGAAATTTPIVDLVAAFGHTGALSEGAREMCAKSVPDLRVVSFSELLLTTFMGMAGRLCTTMRIARKCSISLSVVADVRPSAGQIMPQPIRVA
jgi:hypothetical protein